MVLYDRQIEAVSFVKQELEERDSALVVMPTGTGKSFVITKLCEDLVQQGSKVLLMTPREKIMNQLVSRIRENTKIDVEVEHGTSTLPAVDVVVTTNMTMNNRLEMYGESHFDYILIDEAHHATSSTYKNILYYFEDAKIAGFTATPHRTTYGKRNEYQLSTIFPREPYVYPITDAISDGRLCILSVTAVHTSVDMSTLKVRNWGELDIRDFSNSMAQRIPEVATGLLSNCSDRNKIVAFMPSSLTAQMLAEELTRSGESAVAITSLNTKKEIKEKTEAFSRGDYKFLINCMMFTEGYDEPSIDCIAIMRPTILNHLIIQMIGRGLRLFEGKEDLAVLDFCYDKGDHRFNLATVYDTFNISTESLKRWYSKEVAPKEGRYTPAMLVQEISTRLLERYKNDVANLPPSTQEARFMGILMRSGQDILEYAVRDYVSTVQSMVQEQGLMTYRQANYIKVFSKEEQFDFIFTKKEASFLLTEYERIRARRRSRGTSRILKWYKMVKDIRREYGLVYEYGPSY